MEYFFGPTDLMGWVKNRGAEQASLDLGSAVGNISTESLELSIDEMCKSIEGGDEGAASQLYGVLAKNFEKRKVEASSKNVVKTAQGYRARNKWNRMIEGFNENTPWRVSRDKMYDFTHYAPDAIEFDADPNHVYSQEALWREHIMDKFYREYKNEEGKFVGGYINDRFYVFPDAGTPANPDVPRDGGNQMGLPVGVRSREPRPHQYSMERRLEENRGNETESLKSSVANNFNRFVKVASTNSKQKFKEEDLVPAIYRKAIEDKENKKAYASSVIEIADHFGVNPVSASQVVSAARKAHTRHGGIGYEFLIKSAGSVEVNNGFTTKDLSGEDLNIPAGAKIKNVENNIWEFNGKKFQHNNIAPNSSDISDTGL